MDTSEFDDRLPSAARSLDKAITILNNTSPALVVRLSLKKSNLDDADSIHIEKLRQATLQASPGDFEKNLQALMHALTRRILRSSGTGLEQLVHDNDAPAALRDPSVSFWLYADEERADKLHRVNQEMTSFHGRILIDEFLNFEMLRDHIYNPMVKYLTQASSKASQVQSDLPNPKQAARFLQAWMDNQVDALSPEKPSPSSPAQSRQSPFTNRSVAYLTWQQVDLDRALVIIRHSVKPLLTCLQFSRVYKDIYEKSVFFDELAAEMGNRIPDGRLFRNDRANVLGADFKKGRSPLELAVVWGNNRFVSSSASMTFAKDIWNDPPFSLFGRKFLNAYLVYPSIMARSPAARLALTAIAQITIAALLWFNSHMISTNPGIFEESSLNISFVALYFLAAGQIMEEVFEFLRASWDEVASSDDTRPGISRYINAIPDAYLRYMTVDPWNIVDLLTASLFILALLFRFLGNTTGVFYVFCLTLIPTFVRPLYVLEFHPKLGPLIRSIYNMAADLFRFLAMWSVILLSFAIAFSLLYYEAPSGNFVTYTDSMLTLLSASLGDFSFDAHRLENSEVLNGIGTTLLIIHLALTHVLGLNLLVAIMTSVYERFRDNSIEQYRFGHVRTVLRFSTAVTDFELPTPFNLVQAAGDVFFAWPLGMCLAVRRRMLDKHYRYWHTVKRIRQSIMGLGTDLLVMCCGWVLFSPLLVLGLITVLPLWCMQSRKKLGRKTRVGVPLPSWDAFSHFNKRCSAWCHFLCCDRPVKARKRNLRWPLTENEILGNSSHAPLSSTSVAPAPLTGNELPKDVPIGLQLLRIKMIGMQQMLARIFESQGVLFSRFWNQNIQRHLVTARLVLGDSPSKADPTANDLGSRLKEKFSLALGGPHLVPKDMTHADFAQLLTIGHAMLDLQGSSSQNAPSLQMLLGAKDHSLGFVGRIKPRRFSRVMKLKVGPRPSKFDINRSKSVEEEVVGVGHGGAQAYFVFLHLLPKATVDANGSSRAVAPFLHSTSSIAAPSTILQSLVRSIKSSKHPKLGGEMWERAMLRGNTSKSKDVYGISSRQHLIDATLLLESSPLSRYTYKAWLLEEFHDCCRWEVTKERKIHTVPRRIIAKVNEFVDFDHIAEEDEVDLGGPEEPLVHLEAKGEVGESEEEVKSPGDSDVVGPFKPMAPGSVASAPVPQPSGSGSGSGDGAPEPPRKKEEEEFISDLDDVHERSGSQKEGEAQQPAMEPRDGSEVKEQLPAANNDKGITNEAGDQGEGKE